MPCEGRALVGLLWYEALTLDCTPRMPRMARRARRARMSRSDWGRDKTKSTRMGSL